MIEVVSGVAGVKSRPGQIFPEDAERFSFGCRVITVKQGFSLVNVLVPLCLQDFACPVYVAVDVFTGREVSQKFSNIAYIIEHYLSCHYHVLIFNNDSEMFEFLAKLAGSEWREVPGMWNAPPNSIRNVRREK